MVAIETSLGIHGAGCMSFQTPNPQHSTTRRKPNQQLRIKLENFIQDETTAATNHNNPPVIHDGQFKQSH